MYAVLTSGGKQYRVEAGTMLELERLAVEPGSTVTFDRVLLLADGDSVTVGTPLVEGATVSGTVIGPTLGPKLIIFKFKQKVKYRRKRGHRQHLTRVRIDAINADEKRLKRAEAAKAAAEPTEAAAAPAEATTVPPEAVPAPAAAATQPVEAVPEAEVAEKVERKAPARRRTAAKAAKPDAAEAEAKADEGARGAAEAAADTEQPAEAKPKARRATRPKKSTTAEPAEEK